MSSIPLPAGFVEIGTGVPSHTAYVALEVFRPYFDGLPPLRAHLVSEYPVFVTTFGTKRSKIVSSPPELVMENGGRSQGLFEDTIIGLLSPDGPLKPGCEAFVFAFPPLSTGDFEGLSPAVVFPRYTAPAPHFRKLLAVIERE